MPSTSSHASLRKVPPHNLRRALYRLRRPDEYRTLQDRRNSDGFPTFREFERTKTLFIHSPRTAGNSVWQALYGRKITARVSLDTYRIVFPRRTFEQLYSFTFVRDPWDRTRSAYDFSLVYADKPVSRFADEHIRQYRDFEDFVINGLERESVQRHKLFWPQTSWISLPGQQAPAVDFVGRFENLNEDLETIKERTGLSAGSLPHLYPTGSSPTEWTNGMRQVVAKVYAADVAALGYGDAG